LFLRVCVSVVLKRSLLLVVLNWLFFGALFVGALLGQAGFLGIHMWPLEEEVFTAEASDAVSIFATIFLFNLVLSGFLMVTLTGLAFFVLPVGFLLLRAFLWGVFLNGLPTQLFLASFPTLVLEGEGYVLASLAGVNLGLSWLKPEWAYKGEKLPRSESVKQAFKDCARIYVFVALLLLLGAVVETITLVSLY